MKHLKTPLFLILLMLLGSGCGEEKRMFHVDVDDWEVRESDEKIEFHRTTWVTPEARGTRRPVETVVTLFPARGNSYWEVDTTTWRGQHVKLEHNDAEKRLRIYVDDKPPVELHQNARGLYDYRRKPYRPNLKSDLRKLGKAVAEDLEGYRIEDEAVVATFHAGRDAKTQASQMGRLFFTPIFVDIYTHIEDSMNIGSYNGSTVDSYNHY